MSLLDSSRSGWRLTHASARGKSHVDFGLPNQDWVEVMTSQDRSVIAAVICDGAGTARQSDLGAQVTCRSLAPALLDLGICVQQAPLPLESVRQRIIDVIEGVRADLAARGPLKDFHCTMVLCLLAERGGYVAQVGDSIGLSTRFQYISDGTQEVLDFFPSKHAKVFEPERGEYVNETHFITELDWVEHLRISEIEPSRIDALLLMTDGAMDVALKRGRPFRGFLANLVGNLLAMDDAQERNQLLAEWLSDPQTYPMTADDKTMFLAIPARHESLASEDFLKVDPIDDQGIEPDPWQRFIEFVSRHKSAVASTAAILAIALSIVIGQATQAKLAFDVRGPIKLDWHNYSTAQLSLVAGKKAKVILISVDPPRSLRLLAHQRACVVDAVLTKAQPRCSILIAAGAGSSGDRRSVRVMYRDTDSGEDREIRLDVRVQTESR
jgi:serine/threonine protein phosphatase PrpC